jgi:PHD/YefM family antitoxin component YafN of YafNO toxin-antitoxin module
MRKNANGLLKLATRKKEPIGILKNNKLKAYLIDAKTLEALEEFVEDYLDREMIEKRLHKAKKNDFVDFDKLWKKEKLPT